MRIAFVHQNFPGQYPHLARHLAKAGHDLVAITHDGNKRPELIRTVRYAFGPKEVPATANPLARHYNQAIARAAVVARTALKLREEGFSPDLILGHAGWGETLLLKEVWPRARMQSYSEFYYRTDGADVGFDPEFGAETFESGAMAHTKNAAMLLALATADRGVAPTAWQRSVFPDELHGKIDVVHDGVDTVAVRPDRKAFIRLGKGRLTLRPGDEVITFVNRNLEPYRGYHVFMRALPAILAARPKARAILVGANGVSYGRAAPEGRTWKDIFLDEVRDRLDLSRVHFVGQVPHSTFVNLLQVSAAHVYLTYPFVLSWSMLEAMAAGCLVIASDTPPVAEVIRDGENGLLFPFFDVDALSRRVIEALAEPKQFRQIRAQARADAVERYDLRTRCLPRQLALIEELMT
jgi:glycosyltransferase involved in cell wall biosynthesis